jgi:uncharacterized protein (TIGR02145 family)
MKQLLICMIFISPSFCFGQTETLIDVRDNKIYQTSEINGTVWMLDNLDFVTKQSYEPTTEQKNTYNIKGRYYHLSEIDSVCPIGWQLPDPDDWLGYFELLAKQHDPKVDIEFTGNVMNFTISGYKDEIDIYGKDNPLYLAPTGRYEGTAYNRPNDYSDYWTFDAPTYQTMRDKIHTGEDHVHIMSGAIKGKTHTHIRPASFTNIHTHDHHLKPNQEKKLRRFMVRCVKTTD